MKIKRRFVTLLEVLIGMVLVVILMSVLGFFYRFTATLQAKQEKSYLESFQQRLLSYRLNQIFTHAKKPFFTSDGTQLLFTFDAGVNLDKDFSNDLIARLFVNNDSELVLLMWPAQKRWPEEDLPPVKREVLIENVQTFEIAFFQPPEKWHPEWEEGVPLIIRITLNEKPFQYLIPNATTPITILP